VTCVFSLFTILPLYGFSNGSWVVRQPQGANVELRLEDSRRSHITAYTVPTTLLALTVNQKRTLTGSETLSGVESTVHHSGEVATEDRILDVGV